MTQKVVLITGCSVGGIGNAMAQSFSEAGCLVFASARRISAMENLSDSVQRLELDVGQLESCKAAVNTVLEKAGRIDILAELIYSAVAHINNAGAGATGALLDFDVEKAKAVFDTNLFAVMRLTQLVVPHMAKVNSGLIINIGSVVGVVPTPWAGVYSTSKAALHAWTDCLRMEVKGLGVNVMLVAPGAITSQFGKKQADSLDMPADSLYQSVRPAIQARADMSQRADHTMPASSLANGIVTRALRPTPATYYTDGGKSFLFWLLERIPKSLAHWLLARVLGADKVGR